MCKAVNVEKNETGFLKSGFGGSRVKGSLTKANRISEYIFFSENFDAISCDKKPPALKAGGSGGQEVCCEYETYL